MPDYMNKERIQHANNQGLICLSYILVNLINIIGFYCMGLNSCYNKALYLCDCQHNRNATMNKQESDNKKNPSTNSNISTILNMFIRSKCFASVRIKHKINYNCIVILLACYILSSTGKPYGITRLCNFVRYYSWPLFNRYVDRLVEVNLLTFSGRYYSLTETGLKAVNEIIDNQSSVLYSICSKYNIVL